MTKVQLTTCIYLDSLGQVQRSTLACGLTAPRRSRAEPSWQPVQWFRRAKPSQQKNRVRRRAWARELRSHEQKPRIGGGGAPRVASSGRQPQIPISPWSSSPLTAAVVVALPLARSAATVAPHRPRSMSGQPPPLLARSAATRG